MKIWILGIFATVSAVGCATETLPSETSDLQTAIIKLSVNLDDIRSPTRCVSGIRGPRPRELFRDHIYEQRFIWSELNANPKDILVALDKDCFDRLNEVPPVPLCKGDRLTRGGRVCTVEEIYLVEDEQEARAAALLHLVVEARAEGRDDLPEDDVAAALYLLGKTAG